MITKFDTGRNIFSYRFQNGDVNAPSTEVTKVLVIRAEPKLNRIEFLLPGF
jgi:hypothetical protein